MSVKCGLLCRLSHIHEDVDKYWHCSYWTQQHTLQVNLRADNNAHVFLDAECIVRSGAKSVMEQQLIQSPVQMENYVFPDNHYCTYNSTGHIELIFIFKNVSVPITDYVSVNVKIKPRGHGGRSQSHACALPVEMING